MVTFPKGLGNRFYLNEDLDELNESKCIVDFRMGVVVTVV